MTWTIFANQAGQIPLADLDGNFNLVNGANVLAYGADPTGTTDSTSAIQNAINNNSYVNLPAGTYLVTSSITLNQNTKLVGSNAKIVATGNFNTLAAPNPSVTSSSVSSWTASTGVAVVSNGSLFSPKTVVKLSDGTLSLYSEIISVSGNNVTLADNIDWSFTGSLTLYNTTNLGIVIDGLTFNKTYTGNYYDVAVQSGSIYGVIVRNCSFNNSAGISFAQTAYCQAINNSFNGSYYGVALYDTCHCLISGNTIVNFNQGIISTWTYDNEIVNNDLNNGTDKSYSVGIQISGSNYTTVTTKSTNNKIIGNTVINAQQGVPGSAIGGIHLHVNCANNIVSNNVSNYNGMGIYLETNNTYNTISGNVCNYNGGYYGNGIELDFSGSYNTITNNICCYNSGSVTADESSGIQIRTGYINGTVNSCNSNIVSNNVCAYNGKEGIRLNGVNNSCTGNNLIANGTNSSITNRYEIHVFDASNFTIANNNIYNSQATYGISICGTSEIGSPTLGAGYFTIEGNNISVTASAINAMIVGNLSIASGVNNARIANNNIISAATQRGVWITGKSGTPITYVYVYGNIISHTTNGYNAYESSYLNYYYSANNQLTNSLSSLVGYSSTNSSAGV
jgi:parallel beta-helix repeat protein